MTEASASSPPTVEKDRARGWATDLVRASGIVLVLLLALHVVDLFLVNDIQDETAQSFADRWAMPVWRVADWALVTLSLVHGAIALRPVLVARVGDDRVRAVLTSVLYGAVAVLVGAVTFVALTFRFS